MHCGAANLTVPNWPEAGHRLTETEKIARKEQPDESYDECEGGQRTVGQLVSKDFSNGPEQPGLFTQSLLKKVKDAPKG
jgi:hypothetical protein